MFYNEMNRIPRVGPIATTRSDKTDDDSRMQQLQLQRGSAIHDAQILSAQFKNVHRLVWLLVFIKSTDSFNVIYTYYYY